MATLKWKGSVNSVFDTAGNWTGAGTAVPNSTDVALIGLPGVITVADNVTVAALGMIQTATLDVTARTFTILAGSATGGLAGTILVADSATLALGGVVANSGKIMLASTGNNTDLIVSSVTLTLSGHGQLTLSDKTANRIYGSNSANTLLNVDNTISGAGQLGNGELTFANGAKGTVNANGITALVLNTSNEITVNAGLLESTGSGGLDIITTAVLNSGTVAAVGFGAVVNLNNGTIEGGALATSGGGAIQTTGGYDVLDGWTNGTLSNTGTVQVTDGTALHLEGIIANSGVIADVAQNSNADIVIDTQTVTLAGGGQVGLSNNGGNRIYALSAADTLINLNDTISGAGQLGNGTLTFVNATKGIVLANAAVPLVLNTINEIAVNNGLMQAVGNGSLAIVSTIVRNSGSITAAGGSAAISLSNSSIEGGTLGTSNGAVIETVAGDNTLDGRTNGVLTLVGTVEVSDGTVLDLDGTISNAGKLQLAAISSNTDLVVESQTVTLTGGGAVLLSNNGANRIYGATPADTLINVNNTIAGAGLLGNGGMGFTNEAGGVVDANAATALVLSTGSQIAVNDGTLEATSSGGLAVVSTTVLNAGHIGAVGAGAVIDLSNSDIEGGTLATGRGNGSLVLAVLGSNTLDGQTNGVLTLAGLLRITDGTSLVLDGVIHNSGTLQAAALSNTTAIVVGSQTVTLTGGGLVTLGNSSHNLVNGSASTNTLVNIDNTIEGAGALGNGQMQFSNGAKGVVDANAAIALVLNTGNSILLNAGVLEATGSGGLSVASTTVLNTGRISAIGNGASVNLSSSSIEGGTLTTGNGGVIQTAGGNNTLDGRTNGALSNAGNIRVNSGTTLFLVGTINNTGAISQAQNSAGGHTDIVLGSQSVTLNGRGSLTMSANSGNRIYGAAGGDTLINNGNTISGVGQIGNGQMQLVNTGGGVIDASAASGAIVISLGGQVLTNRGASLLATGFGGLVLQNLILDNAGMVEAGNNSSVLLASSVTTANNSAGVLTGGVWEASASGSGATLDITGGPVQIDAATIVLSGFGSTFAAWNGSAYQDIATSLTTIAAGGQLQLLSNRGYITSLALTDAGRITLGGNVLTAGGLTVAARGVLSGFGTVTGALTNAGLVAASGGLLLMSGSISGTGSLSIGAGATLDLRGATSETVTFSKGAAELLLLDSPATFQGGFAGLTVGDAIAFGGSTLAGPVVANGKLTVDVAGKSRVFAVSGALTNTHFIVKTDPVHGQELVLTAGAAAHGDGGGLAPTSADLLALPWHP